MLTPHQAQILQFVHDHSDTDIFFDDLADRFGRPDSESRLLILIDSGFLDRRMFPGTVTLTAKGFAALDQYESALQKEAEKRACEERDQNLQNALEDKRWRKDARRSWVQWTITTILTLLSFFAGAVVEVLTGFMQWILALLH